MLNEVMTMLQGIPPDIEIQVQHIDIKDVGRKPTLRVRLDRQGQVSGLDPIPGDLPLWTFGKGKKQRFPFMQPNVPLMHVNNERSKAKLEIHRSLRADKRRNSFLDLCQEAVINEDPLVDWPGTRDKNGTWSQNPVEYFDGLRERRRQVQSLVGTEGGSVPAAIDRFLMACSEGRGLNLLRQIVSKFIHELRDMNNEDWLRIGEPLLFFGGGALFFDVPSTEFLRLTSDPRQKWAISDALKASEKGDCLRGKCALSGKDGMRLVKGTFPELVMPVIGNTILFSRFDAIPSNARYGKFGAKSFAASQSVVEKLAGTLRFLSSPDREGLTWKSIPGEIPRQSDLLIAYVHKLGAEAAVAGLLSEATEDYAEEDGDTTNLANSLAGFEERTRRLIEAVKAKVNVDWSNTPVSLAILRKVDPANRKIICASMPTASEIYHAAKAWLAGERNTPCWLRLPITMKATKNPRMSQPGHIPPLQVTAILKKVYIRGGTESQESVGLPSSEILRFFFDPNRGSRMSSIRAKRVLRLILTRQANLLSGVGKILHTPESWLRRGEFVKQFDMSEALRTATLLGILLFRFNRTKEVYMKEVAFKLGQLLAVADVVHAGYCADVRGGDIPPSLLGNQVFPMAQSSPSKALATLCRRWKPYDGWAKKVAHEPNRISKLIESDVTGERRRGWDMRKALRCAREVGTLATELAPLLEGCRIDDIFLAELLLGYMAGLPKGQNEREDIGKTDSEKQEE